MDVYIRRFKDGDLIALFPKVKFDNVGNIMSYMTIGQHGAASPTLIHELASVENNSEDVMEFKKELRAVGYEIE